MKLPFPMATSVCLHITTDPTFTRKYGKKVKEAGGYYSSVIGLTSTRYVFIPFDPRNFELIDKIVEKFEAFTLIIKGNFNGEGIPGVYHKKNINSINVLYKGWLKDVEKWYSKFGNLSLEGEDRTRVYRGSEAREIKLISKLLRHIRSNQLFVHEAWKATQPME